MTDSFKHGRLSVWAHMYARRTDVPTMENRKMHCSALPHAVGGASRKPMALIEIGWLAVSVDVLDTQIGLKSISSEIKSISPHELLNRGLLQTGPIKEDNTRLSCIFNQLNEQKILQRRHNK